MLEDFVAGLIPENDPLWPRAAAAVDEIPNHERRFGGTGDAKAKIHTWLAWQEVPGVRMGSAVSQCYLVADSPLASRFVAWCRRLLVGVRPVSP